MPRTRAFDEEKALTAVQNLFWEKGYEGTSYADLTAATGLGKGSLYAAFGNKHALYLRVLDIYVKEDIDGVGAAFMARHQENPDDWQKRIAELYDVAIAAVAERQDRRGCFVCNASVDLAPFDKEVEAIVLAALGRFRALIEHIIANAVSEDEKSAKADQILATYIGMRVFAKAGFSVAQLTALRNSALQSLSG